MSRNKVAAAVLTFALAGGGATGVILSRAAGAETGSTTTTPTAPASGTTAPPAPDPAQRKADAITSALQGLVDDGTLTAAQRDAVVKALQDAPVGGPGGHGPGGRKGGPGGPGGPGGFGGFGGIVKGGLDAAATALGIDVATLEQNLRSGKSIATVAGEKNVPVDTVVKAIVDEATAAIDKAVTDGKLTQAQADAAKKDLTQRVTDLVNGTGFPGGRRGPGGPGHGRPDDGDADDAPATGSAPASATPSSAQGTTA